MSKNNRRLNEADEIPLEAQAEARLAEKVRNQERRKRMEEDKEKRLTKKQNNSSKRRRVDEESDDDYDQMVKEYNVKL